MTITDIFCCLTPQIRMKGSSTWCWKQQHIVSAWFTVQLQKTIPCSPIHRPCSFSLNQFEYAVAWAKSTFRYIHEVVPKRDAKGCFINPFQFGIGGTKGTPLILWINQQQLGIYRDILYIMGIIMGFHDGQWWLNMVNHDE